MVSLMVRSSTTERSDSERDRYSVIRQLHVSRSRDLDDDEETYDNHSSHHQPSTASESSYSGTYGTSMMSEGSEVIDNDEYFVDDDYLSLESQPMAVDRWVDSACGCLDRPVSVYQNMCSRRETSLLRQSKGKPRSTFTTRKSAIPTPNLTSSAIKRRSLRLQGRSIFKNEENDNAEPTVEETKKNEIQMMQIQPKEDYEVKEVVGLESESNTGASNPSNSGQDPDTTDEPSAKQEKPAEASFEKIEVDQQNGETHSLEASGSLDVASMVERAIEMSAKEGEEREIKTQFSTGSRDRSVKLDPPTESHIVPTREGQDADYHSPNHSGFEASMSENDGEKVVQVDDQDLPSPPANENKPDDEETRNSDIVSTSPEQEDTHASSEEKNLTLSHENTEEIADEKSLSSSMEIIEILSMDDQDSWIPGSRNETEQSTDRSGDDLVRSLTRIPPSPNVDQIWVEEEAKLEKKVISNGVGALQSKDLINVEVTNDLRNEERTKLHKSVDDIFDDPKAREAFLNRRQGRLRDTPIPSRNTPLSLPTQKRIQQDPKEDTRKEDPEESRGKNRLARSKSNGRNPPSPELRAELMHSGSRSREQNLAKKSTHYQEEGVASLTSSALSSRMKDLVAIRSIEEGQRMRSSRRASENYRADPVSNIHAPIDVHSYTAESSSRVPYDELQSRSSHRRTSNRHLRPSTPSRTRSRSRDPTGITHIHHYDDFNKNHRPNDERDDKESLSTIIPIEKRPIQDTALTATEKLRKLEQKIERQLRQVRRETHAQQELDPQTVHFNEIRRIEKKLASKLKAFRSDDPDGQNVSSREIRKLEKQLAQKMSSDSDKRASKLKRIKRKGVSSARSLVSSSGKLREDRQQQSKTPYPEPELVGSPEIMTTPHSSKAFLHKSQETRSERTKYETLQGLRSRYGRRGYSRVPETD
mmetsp:Transcript_26875/g.62854  ORF Transcript_26875/g.62854 Transcript_26875/m.62854 type:complete len:929 (+) Transcript_26875:99-2885(+)